jgi:hypothetical protein
MNGSAGDHAGVIAEQQTTEGGDHRDRLQGLSLHVRAAAVQERVELGLRDPSCWHQRPRLVFDRRHWLPSFCGAEEAAPGSGIGGGSWLPRATPQKTCFEGGARASDIAGT